ncbi:3-hydroxyacyl-CoA dehydrogenase family protein, partial [Pseudomonas putida]
VEVIQGLKTDAKHVETMMQLSHAFGHRAVVAKDTPGFIVNHAGRGYGTEALKILNESVTTFSEIDRILREGVGFKMGPFELLDLTGLDVSH